MRQNSALPIQCITDWARSAGRNDIGDMIAEFENVTRQQIPTTQTATESTSNNLDGTSDLVMTPSYAPPGAAIAPDPLENNPPSATGQDETDGSEKLLYLHITTESEDCNSPDPPSVPVTSTEQREDEREELEMLT